MTPPLLINNLGDVTVLETFDPADVPLEACDVLDGEYVAYDSQGHLLTLDVVQGRVVVAEAEAGPPHAEELRLVLLHFLKQVDALQPWLEGAPLDVLVSKMMHKRW